MPPRKARRPGDGQRELMVVGETKAWAQKHNGALAHIEVTSDAAIYHHQFQGRPTTVDLKTENSRLNTAVLDEKLLHEITKLRQHLGSANPSDPVAQAQDRILGPLREALEVAAPNQGLLEANGTLSAENQTLLANNQTLAGNNGTLSASNQTLAAQNQALSEGNQALSEENEALSANNQTLSAKNKALSTKIQTVLQANDKLVESELVLKRKVGDLKQRRKQDQLDITDLTKRKMRYLSENVALRTRNTRLVQQRWRLVSRRLVEERARSLDRRKHTATVGWWRSLVHCLRVSLRQARDHARQQHSQGYAAMWKHAIRQVIEINAHQRDRAIATTLKTHAFGLSTELAHQRRTARTLARQQRSQRYAAMWKHVIRHVIESNAQQRDRTSARIFRTRARIFRTRASEVSAELAHERDLAQDRVSHRNAMLAQKTAQESSQRSIYYRAQWRQAYQLIVERRAQTTKLSTVQWLALQRKALLAQTTLQESNQRSKYYRALWRQAYQLIVERRAQATKLSTVQWLALQRKALLAQKTLQERNQRSKYYLALWRRVFDLSNVRNNVRVLFENARIKAQTKIEAKNDKIKEKNRLIRELQDRARCNARARIRLASKLYTTVDSSKRLRLRLGLQFVSVERELNVAQQAVSQLRVDSETKQTQQKHALKEQVQLVRHGKNLLNVLLRRNKDLRLSSKRLRRTNTKALFDVKQRHIIVLTEKQSEIEKTCTETQKLLRQARSNHLLEIKMLNNWHNELTERIKRAYAHQHSRPRPSVAVFKSLSSQISDSLRTLEDTVTTDTLRIAKLTVRLQNAESENTKLEKRMSQVESDATGCYSKLEAVTISRESLVEEARAMKAMHLELSGQVHRVLQAFRAHVQDLETENGSLQTENADLIQGGQKMCKEFRVTVQSVKALLRAIGIGSAGD